MKSVLKTMTSVNILKPQNLLGMSAAGLLLLAQSVYGQQQDDATLEEEAQNIELEQYDFDEVDRNNDGVITPDELNGALDVQLSELGWDEQNVFDDYDANQDEALDEMEYYALTRAVVERQEFRAAELDDEAVENEEAPAEGELVQATVTVTPVREVPVDELVDRELVDSQGETVGTIEEVVTRENGSERGLVVSSGGFFGIGGRSAVVDADEVNMTEEDRLVWESATGEENLEDQPEYNEDEYVTVQ